MGKELERSPIRGEVLSEEQALIAQAGGTDSETLNKLSQRASLARTFIWQIAEGRSGLSAEQKERLVSACNTLIEERKERGELREIPSGE